MTQTQINNYKNALVEVEAVLNCIETEVYNKIPKDIINAIEKNKNKDYKYYYNEKLDYEKWNLSNEAKALLYNIYKDYIATEKEKDYFKKREKFETYKLEKQKSLRYYSHDIFENKNQQDVNKDLKNDSKDLVELKKENCFKKILKKIKEVLKGEKR